MRSMEEIQSEIAELDRQIEALEAEIQQEEALMQTEEYRRGRRDYIDRGDSTVLNNMHARALQERQHAWQKKMDEERLKLEERQVTLQEREAGYGKGGEGISADSKKGKELARNYKNALYAVEQAKEQFSKSGSDAAKGAIYAANTELNKAKGALEDAGLAYLIPEEPKKPEEPIKKEWTINDVDAFDRDIMVAARNATKGKDKFYWADKDYDAARQQAWEMSGSPDADVRARGMKLLTEIDGMRKFRESDRKSAEGAATAAKQKRQNAFDNERNFVKAKAKKDGYWIYENKIYSVDKAGNVGGVIKGK